MRKTSARVRSTCDTLQASSLRETQAELLRESHLTAEAARNSAVALSERLNELNGTQRRQASQCDESRACLAPVSAECGPSMCICRPPRIQPTRGVLFKLCFAIVVVL